MPRDSQEVKAIMPSVQTPSEFNFEKPESWALWLKRFERYVSVANLKDRAESEKIDLLLYTMGEKAEEILAQIAIGSSVATLKTVTDKFTEYFSPKKNTIFERYKFNSRKQQLGESVDSFVTALYSLAETCEYGALKEELIRDRIVIGVKDTRVSERLQLSADLTLEKALNKARQAETQAKEGKIIRKEAEVEKSELNRVLRSRKYKGETKNYPEQRDSKNKMQRGNESCGRCGKARHADFKKCPALKTTCHKCQKVGHWDKMCKSKKVRRVKEQEDDESDDSEMSPIFLGTIRENLRPKGEFLFRAYVREFSQQINFIIDTGADVTCISTDTVPEKLKDKINKTDRIILGPDGKRLSVAGYIQLNLKKENISTSTKTYVLNGLKQNLLGKPEISKFKLVNQINYLQSKSQTRILPFVEYSKVFNGLEKVKNTSERGV